MLKQIVIAGCLAIGAMSGQAIALAEDAPATQPTTEPTAGTPVNKYCMVSKKDAIDPKVTYLYNGKTYGFCCEDCAKDFKKDPEKYLKDAK